MLKLPVFFVLFGVIHTQNSVDTDDLVPCINFKHSKDKRPVNCTAKCGVRVSFGYDPQIGRNVLIEGGRFDDDLYVGSHSMLGESIRAGYGVYIGRGSCVEDGVRLDNNKQIQAYNAVRQTPGKIIRTERPKYERRFVLQGGKCLQVDGFDRCSKIAESKKMVKIHPNSECFFDSYLSPHLTINANVKIGRNTSIGEGSKLGIGVRTGARVRVGKSVVLGRRVCVEDCTRIPNGLIVPKGAKVEGEGKYTTPKGSLEYKFEKGKCVLLKSGKLRRSTSGTARSGKGARPIVRSSRSSASADRSSSRSRSRKEAPGISRSLPITSQERDKSNVMKSKSLQEHIDESAMNSDKDMDSGSARSGKRARSIVRSSRRSSSADRSASRSRSRKEAPGISRSLPVASQEHDESNAIKSKSLQEDIGESAMNSDKDMDSGSARSGKQARSIVRSSRSSSSADRSSSRSRSRKEALGISRFLPVTSRKRYESNAMKKKSLQEDIDESAMDSNKDMNVDAPGAYEKQESTYLSGDEEAEDPSTENTLANMSTYLNSMNRRLLGGGADQTEFEENVQDTEDESIMDEDEDTDEDDWDYDDDIMQPTHSNKGEKTKSPTAQHQLTHSRQGRKNKAKLAVAVPPHSSKKKKAHQPNSMKRQPLKEAIDESPMEDNDDMDMDDEEPNEEATL